MVTLIFENNFNQNSEGGEMKFKLQMLNMYLPQQDFTVFAI